MARSILDQCHPDSEERDCCWTFAYHPVYVHAQQGSSFARRGRSSREHCFGRRSGARAKTHKLYVLHTFLVSVSCKAFSLETPSRYAEAMKLFNDAITSTGYQALAPRHFSSFLRPSAFEALQGKPCVQHRPVLL